MSSYAYMCHKARSLLIIYERQMEFPARRPERRRLWAILQILVWVDQQQ